HGDIANHLQGTPFSLSTLVVGTQEGGPIPLAQRGFIRDNGTIVITRANPDALARLARDNDGKSHPLTLGDDDIRRLRLHPNLSDDRSQDRDVLTVNRWQDDGYWLLWLALPLLLLGWKKGALALCLMAIVPLTLAPRPAMAVDWAGLWQREDQRGRQLIEQDPARATELLQQPGWRGSALYRDGRYDEAAQTFAEQSGAPGHYNRGNALARSGQLEQALDAYQQALQQNPELDDARANHELVKQLLEQQQQESESQSDSDSQQNPESQGDSSDQDDDPQQGEGSQSEQDSQGSAGDQPQEPDQGQDETQSPTEPPAQAPGEAPTEAPAEVTEQPLSQGQEQWLRRVPDNPGGLLQRKFLQQHQQRQTTPDEGDTPW
ncbi:MAG: tetratricopeptide repeat protein, partial [Marinobacter sp.]